jgi:hypothetical protein
MNTKITQAVVAVALIAVFSVATGIVVHHDDQTSSAHAMMVSSSMEKTTVMKAESTAAMKQKASDEMAEHNDMTNSTSDGMN